MPWSFGRKRMVRRTCLDCGETWTLQANLARLRPARPHGHVGGYAVGGYGVGGYGATPAYLRYDRLNVEQELTVAEAGFDQELETIRQARTCPKCGSERYKDRRR